MGLLSKWKAGGWDLKLTLSVLFFAAAAWIQVNGIWVELPLLVENSPQQWKLPAYLTVVIQMANIAPLTYLILSKYVRIKGKKLITEIPTIYVILLIEIAVACGLSFLWKHTSNINGVRYSTWLIALNFIVAAVDATSVVTFLPFMAHFPQKYMIVFYTGAGMSGFLPSIAALIQGVGKQTYTCIRGNSSSPAPMLQRAQPDLVLDLERNSIVRATPSLIKAVYSNESSTTVVYHKKDPLFSVQIFFFLITAILVSSFLAFVVLVRIKQKLKKIEDGEKEQQRSNEELKMDTMDDSCPNDKADQESNDGSSQTSVKHALPNKTVLLLLVMNVIINCFGNGILPALQSYACMPYGSSIYHLTLTMSSSINPIACFLYFFIDVKSVKVLFIGVVLYLISAGYTIFIAAQSPCPVLNHSIAGGIIVLVVTVLGVGLVSYLRTAIGTILQQQGRQALVACGVSTQLGSLIGAVTMFPIVSVYELFQQSVPCKTCS